MNSDRINFDPNMNLSGEMSYKTFRLTFGLWTYRATKEVTVGGNCAGLSSLDAAVGAIYEEIADEGITMTKENGEKLLTCDDEEQGERWLMDMLIAAEIIAVEPQKVQY